VAEGTVASVRFRRLLAEGSVSDEGGRRIPFSELFTNEVATTSSNT